MATEFVKGTPADSADILDFGNYVFSHAHRPTDFVKLVPKLYREGNEVPQQHYLAKEDGKIKAMIGCFPLEINVLGTPLKLAGIGTVAGHPYSRGAGYMRTLMQSALADMRKDGVVLSVLGGQRQRYEYFGYEPSGVQLRFSVISDNLRHRFKTLDANGITFAPIAREDCTTLAECARLHERHPLTYTRDSAKLFDILSSWDCVPTGIYENGAMIGYLARSSDATALNELELEDITRLPGVLKAYLPAFGVSHVSLSACPFETGKIDLLADFCESFAVGTDDNYAVLQFLPVIKALLTLKAQTCRLADGEWVVNIQGHETLRIHVENGSVQVTPALESQAETTLTYLQAVRLFFSDAARYERLGTQLPGFAASWLPLPLSTFRQDGV